MVHSSERLFNVPQPELFEAGSCWLSRLALAQGAGMNEVLKFFRLTGSADLDRRLQGQRLAVIRRICGLPETALMIHERVMASLERMSPVGDRYLALSESNRPRFRYCPDCLSEMRTPHFPIHWRFIAWRWCSIHDCLLEDGCPHCGEAILFPIDIAASKAGRLGYAMLNRCRFCSLRIDDVEPCYLRVGDFRRVSSLEQLILENGRGLLASLYHGWFAIKGRPGHFQLSRFNEIERYGALPVRFDWLAPAQVRKRSVNGTEFCVEQWNSFLADA